jgi:XTP/dITP diphosphohydrolase
MPNETGHTFADNAVLKAVTVSKDRQLRDRLVIADDSGLEVEALGGAPGIYSARYAGERATDRENVEKLLNELCARNGNRSARFCCVIALVRNGKLLRTVEGAVEGEIVDLPRGANGFGYDPVFQPNGFEQTFAEMAPELKNKISHRAKAIATLREALREIEN